MPSFCHLVQTFVGMWALVVSFQPLPHHVLECTGGGGEASHYKPRLHQGPQLELFGNLALSTPIILTLLLTQSWGGRSAEALHYLAVPLGRPPSLGGQGLWAMMPALAEHMRHW